MVRVCAKESEAISRNKVLSQLTRFRYVDFLFIANQIELVNTMGVKSFVPVTNFLAWHFHSPPKGRVRKGQKTSVMTY